MLNVSEERPLHPATAALLRLVSDTTRRLGTSFVVAGATARDIILWQVYGVKAERATRDVDVAVCAVSWDLHESLVAALAALDGFRRDDRAQQRLRFTHAGTGMTLPLDLVPFGDIEAPKGSIAWPPERKVVLTVLGFREAVDTAAQVKVEADNVVPVVALPALTLLKLLAWEDRRLTENKDASDLLLILRSYLWAGNEERIWTEAVDLMELHGFDDSIASSALLGRDARHAALPATLEKVRSLLADDRTYRKLLGDLLARAAAAPFDEGYADSIETNLQAFRDSFLAES
ncbi:nucleotidyl transferase AbiEii/AbiGii toxin family protein [Paraburkholderia saeva]|uniref:Nucleotidyltransferase n=1 Tax=Paraburkholderia saeva TaxID=2777537 RepID=A0A9N8RVE8_9BURK|nr:nucleotidyl transferase AbiEii/AbiGii toxin family protein [Paraburkholderia saeva]CAG4894757.1 hypothetical protein LMG31841_01982 [Paraburkholderia saeva]